MKLLVVHQTPAVRERYNRNYMIRIEVRDERYLYNIYHLAEAFYPSEKTEQRINGDMKEDARITVSGRWTRSFDVSGAEDKKMRKFLLDKAVYEALAECAGHGLAWGILTGVRPTKLAMQKVEEGMEREAFISWFGQEFYVSGDKAGLAYDIAVREKRVLRGMDLRQGYSLYVSIPFCPTVCSYCSFSSGSLAVWKNMVDDYLEALCRELRCIGSVSGGRRLNTIYIGGGTPAALEAEQLERLLSCIDETFSREYLLEYTIEAGRPDSITREKLQVIRDHRASRISINPQTMQQRTLDRIGRRHSTEEVVNSFLTAREMGFDNINMDLIAGLPGETAEDMKDTLRQIKELAPDSLTVHSLAIKRAAKMGQEKSVLGYVKDLEEQMKNPAQMAAEVSQMIEAAGEAAEEMELTPYYLYRQKNIAGNFENVGYAEVDKAGIYNILIMEEKQSIVAAGAGAQTKLLLPLPVSVSGGRNEKLTTLKRVENVKNIRDYILRIDEMIERKGEWLWR